MKSMKMMKKQAQAGFTLIELMIVVAIIGILAAVAIPAYQEYVAKSKFAAALGEVSGAKTPFDILMNDGETPDAMSDLKLADTTANCAFSAPTVGGIVCAIEGGPSEISDKTITLTRDVDGVWTCGTDADQKYVGAVGICTGQ